MSPGHIPPWAQVTGHRGDRPAVPPGRVRGDRGDTHPQVPLGHVPPWAQIAVTVGTDPQCHQHGATTGTDHQPPWGHRATVPPRHAPLRAQVSGDYGDRPTSATGTCPTAVSGDSGDTLAVPREELTAALSAQTPRQRSQDSLSPQSPLPQRGQPRSFPPGRCPEPGPGLPVLTPPCSRRGSRPCSPGSWPSARPNPLRW